MPVAALFRTPSCISRSALRLRSSSACTSSFSRWTCLGLALGLGFGFWFGLGLGFGFGLGLGFGLGFGLGLGLASRG